MPRDSGGTYSLPSNTLAVSGNTISSTYYNNAVNDFAAEFTASLPVDGRKALTGKLLGYSGTASSPSYSFSADTDTGFYPHATSGIGVAVDGTGRFRMYYDGTYSRITDGTNTLTLTSIANNKLLGNLSGGAAYPSEVTAVGLQTIWIPAPGMISRTTNGPSSGTAETTTNKVMIKTLDFDASTQEFAQFSIAMPKSWNNSTVTAQFCWSHASTTTNFGVVWGIQGVALSDDDAADTAFGTAQTVADTGGTTNDIYWTIATSAVTISGTPATGDIVVFQVYRLPSDGSDTMAVDARLHGVKLFYTNTALTDD
jgi:hypothetical protein